MDEIGISIFVTTLTTFLAFMLGSVTKIPAVRWFCFYAGPCVFIDFIYQITFFVAVLKLDQIRIRSGRYDIICCCKSSRPSTSAVETSDKDPNIEVDAKDEEDNDATEVRQDDVREPIDSMDNEADAAIYVPGEGKGRKLDFTSRLMAKYISFILRPATKACVLIFFAVLLILGAISASKMKETFDFRTMTASGSYLNAYLDATEVYFGDTPGLFDVFVYARDVDFTAEENRTAMDNFVNDMVGLDYITHYPSDYWLKDFKYFIDQASADVKSKSFNDQISIFLETEPYKAIHTDHIIRDSAGNLIVSRVKMFYDKVDQADVKNQVTALLDQRRVSKSQPLNDGMEDWAFFSFANMYPIWEFYSVVVNELILTTVLAISSVAVITLFFIPHPVGCVIVTLTVSVVFVDLLGLMQIAGLDINSVTSIGLVISIGLVVDFVTHVVHIYFEVDEDTRDKKVEQTLMTMGKSILVGGFSTFLGTLPLCLGTSEVFWTFFVTFLGIVALGVSHGIMFIPVVLSLFAPVYRPERPHVPKQQYLASSAQL
uniref:SSD domain-containing protein n=1 Tax=Helicotheca tamesis TaxID=374047 RepID=A0A7S2MTM1_9STRA|mmetsp:Transcript_3118/g.4213  ORF Transcript_3118/g.4213 Transcript_3118/m.4213 type:complete len:543 (+) Transcript_3118:471-2099(+)